MTKFKAKLNSPALLAEMSRVADEYAGIQSNAESIAENMFGAIPKSVDKESKKLNPYEKGSCTSTKQLSTDTKMIFTRRLWP